MKEDALRIAALFSSATEILYGLGLESQIVAVSHESDFPEQAKHKPSVTFSNIADHRSSVDIDSQVRQLTQEGNALYEIDRAKLVALQPDLIVTQQQCDVCAVKYEDVLEVVRSHGALVGTQIIALNPSSLGEILTDIAEVGRAARCPDVASAYIKTLQARIARVSSLSVDMPTENRPRVACIEWIEPMMLAANWVPELVSVAGGDHGLTQGGRHSTYVAWEALLRYDPEILIVSPCGFDLSRTITESQVLFQQRGWSTISAVQNKRVFALDGNAYLNRSGPRIVDSLEILAHLIQPERFDVPIGVTEWMSVCHAL